jgi:hypothetical protein
MSPMVPSSLMMPFCFAIFFVFKGFKKNTVAGPLRRARRQQPTNSEQEQDYPC